MGQRQNPAGENTHAHGAQARFRINLLKSWKRIEILSQNKAKNDNAGISRSVLMERISPSQRSRTSDSTTWTARFTRIARRARTLISLTLLPDNWHIFLFYNEL